MSEHCTEKSLQKLEHQFWENLKKSGEEIDLKYARDLPDDTPDFILQRLSEFERDVAEFCFDGSCGFVLDAGCGNGNLLMRSLDLHSQRMTCYIGLDFSRNMLGRAAFRARDMQSSFFSQGCVNHLPFKDKSFERVVSSGVLTCLPTVQEADAALSEFNRVLKPGGILVVDFFNCRSHFTLVRKHILREDIRSPEYVSSAEFRSQLKAAGFETLGCRGFDFKPYQGYLFMSRWRPLIDPCFVQERFTRFLESHVAPKHAGLSLHGYRIYVKCRKK